MTGLRTETFGELLTVLRMRAGLTISALATKVGRHRNQVGAWEAGSSLPDEAVLSALSEALRYPEAMLRVARSGGEVAEATRGALEEIADRAGRLAEDLKAVAATGLTEAEREALRIGKGMVRPDGDVQDGGGG